MRLKWKLDFTIWQGDSSLIDIYWCKRTPDSTIWRKSNQVQWNICSRLKNSPPPPLFPRSRFCIFAGDLSFFALFLPVPPLLSRAWNRLLHAVPGKRSGKREEVIVGLFMKNGGRISVTAVGKRRNKLRNWPRNPRDVYFSAQKAVKVEQAKWTTVDSR